MKLLRWFGLTLLMSAISATVVLFVITSIASFATMSFCSLNCVDELGRAVTGLVWSILTVFGGVAALMKVTM